MWHVQFARYNRFFCLSFSSRDAAVRFATWVKMLSSVNPDNVGIFQESP